MPKFTIAIPAYNRASFLPRVIGSALNQSYPDVEVLVSDDGSNDEVREVVESFGGRVRYHRNERNIGMWPNFALLTTLADGEYFSWLQDDDMVHRDYAKRAVEALDSDPEICMYTAYSIDSYSCETFVLPQIIGPPIAVDWMDPKLKVIDGSIVLPISLFMTFSMPPITAYRTEVIRDAVADINPDHILFNERIIQSKAVDGRKIAVDPCPAGIFYKHELQGSLLGGSCDVQERSRQWVLMCNEVASLLERKPAELWKRNLDAWLESVSAQDKLTLYFQLAPGTYWKDLAPIAREICSRLIPFLPEHLQRKYREEISGVRQTGGRIKHLSKGLMPPLLWDSFKAMKSTLRSREKA